MDLGSTEHSFELRTHPQCTALRANPFAASRLGRLRLPRFRTFGGIVDSGQDCRLRLRGVAFGPFWLFPTPVFRHHINYPVGWSPSTISPPYPKTALLLRFDVGFEWPPLAPVQWRSEQRSDGQSPYLSIPIG